MVGDLDVAIADQNATLAFRGDYILFRFATYRAATGLMKHPPPNLNAIVRFLEFSRIGVKAQIGEGKQYELFPNPNWFVRWLNPALRKMRVSTSE